MARSTNGSPTFTPRIPAATTFPATLCTIDFMDDTASG